MGVHGLVMAEGVEIGVDGGGWEVYGFGIAVVDVRGLAFIVVPVVRCIRVF
jgi:hypothetical protein